MFVLCAYNFFVGFKPILKNETFLAVFEPFSLLHGGKIKSARIFFAHGSKVLREKIGGSTHLLAPLVKKYKQNLKKQLFFGIP